MHRVGASQIFEKLQQHLMNKCLKNAFMALKEHKIRQKHVEGASILVDWANRRILSKALIQWLKSVYQEEIML